MWETLARGITPAADIIENRMRNWVKWLGRREPTEYGTALPLELPVGNDEGTPLLVRDVISRDPLPLPGHDPLA